MKKSIFLIVVLSISSLLLAQRRTAPPSAAVAGARVSQDAAANAPDTTTCSFAYSSGTGVNRTDYCLSVNGNIVQFSRPAGNEYIAVGTIDEGYGICDITGGSVRYSDYAWTATPNWGATSVFFPNAATAKFIRTTTDGIWTLTQTITRVNASGTGPGAAKVSMAIKNNSVAREIFVVRHADVDAGGVLSNNFDQSQDAAFGNQNFFDGLALTDNTFAFPDHYAATWNIFSGPDPCNFNVNRLSAPATGVDGSIGHLWHLVVPAGATKTLVSTYKPY